MQNHFPDFLLNCAYIATGGSAVLVLLCFRSIQMRLGWERALAAAGAAFFAGTTFVAFGELGALQKDKQRFAVTSAFCDDSLLGLSKDAARARMKKAAGSNLLVQVIADRHQMSMMSAGYSVVRSSCQLNLNKRGVVDGQFFYVYER